MRSFLLRWLLILAVLCPTSVYADEPMPLPGAAATGYAFVPDAGIRFRVPQGWFVRSEARDGMCTVFVTRERIAEPGMPYRMGVSVSIGLEKAFGRVFTDDRDRMRSISSAIAGGVALPFDRCFSLNGNGIVFYACEFAALTPGATAVYAVNARAQTTLVSYMAPQEEWSAAKDALAAFVRSVEWDTGFRERDAIVASVS